MEKIKKLSILLILLFLVIAIPVVSAEENTTSDNIEIDNSITIGPDDSIQEAVNNANSSSTIYLTPGTYYQHGIEVNKNLTFQGKGNAQDVIIDGEKKNNLFSINSVSTVTFINITFINGKSPEWGGAINSEHGGKIYVDSCIFENNTAGVNGGAIAISGEQINHYGTKITHKGYLKVNNSQFINNYAGHDGGAVCTYWGDTYIYSSVFRYNYAYRDGGATRTGVYSTTTVEDCIFENNTAREWGGALYNWPGELTVNNCTIANNTAGTKGAAIITSGPLEVTNSHITNNYGETGVIYVDEETPAIPSRVIFHNNYIVDNYPEDGKIFVIDQSTAKDSDINNNYFGTTNTTTIVDDETGNFPIPTKFINKNPDTPVDPTPDTPVNPNTPDTPANSTNPDTPVNPNTPVTPSNPDTNIPANQTENPTNNFIDGVISAITNEVNKVTSNANKIVSNSTENNINVGTDASQEATKSSDSGKSVHELHNKEVSKQTQINPIPYILVLIIVFAVLIFGYYRHKKNE